MKDKKPSKESIELANKIQESINLKKLYTKKTKNGAS